MRLVFVCFYQAFPPDCGADSVTWNVVKHSCGERILIQVGPSSSEEATKDGITIITLPGTSNSRWRKLGALRGRIRQIAHTIEHIRPQVVVLEGASWVLYHLLLAREIGKRQLETTIVYHSHNVEYLLRKDRDGPMVTAVTRWAERRLLREADMSFAVSEADRQQFEALYGISPQLLPNGVDLEVFDRVTEDEVQAVKAQYSLNDNMILFMGAYVYKPNREAIDFLVNSVMPMVVQQQPDARLAIIGGKVPVEEPWLTNPGTIPHTQLPAFVKACAVGVAPIFSGSGTRLKILEYMAAGLPVVATPKGAEGLNVIHGRDISVREGEQDFVSSIVDLLQDPRASALLGNHGHQAVMRHYSWKPIMKNFHEIVGGMTGID